MVNPQLKIFSESLRLFRGFWFRWICKRSCFEIETSATIKFAVFDEIDEDRIWKNDVIVEWRSSTDTCRRNSKSQFNNETTRWASATTSYVDIQAWSHQSKSRHCEKNHRRSSQRTSRKSSNDRRVRRRAKDSWGWEATISATNSRVAQDFKSRLTLRENFIYSF